MKRILVPFLAVAFFAPQLSYAQRRSSKARTAVESLSLMDAAAECAWKPFFSKFRIAVRKRDRETLKKMMVPGFLYSLGGGADCCDGDNRDEAFQFWDNPNVRGWEAFDRILSEGAVPQAAWWSNGEKKARPSRVAPAAANIRRNIKRDRIQWYAIFEFHEDGQWYCDIFQQCCD